MNLINLNLGSKNLVVRARVGGANTTSILAAHFAKQNTKFGVGGKRGRAKIHSPQPPFFLPARASGFIPAARSAAISQDFVQKRFEQGSVIATKLDIEYLKENALARFARSRRTKSPAMMRQFAKLPTNPSSLFWQADDGSELRSNSQMKSVSNFFFSAFG